MVPYVALKGSKFLIFMRNIKLQSISKALAAANNRLSQFSNKITVSYKVCLQILRPYIA
jgi:hypothetical protein